MKITQQMLKLAHENSATPDCINWMISILDEKITRENIDPRHYIWLLSIGIIDLESTGRVIELVMSKEPGQTLKHVCNLLTIDQVHYCTRLNPLAGLMYASHRLADRIIEQCVTNCMHMKLITI